MDISAQENKEIAQKLIDSAGVVIIYLDPEGKVNFCNKKIYELTGLRQKNIIGSDWLNLLSGDSDNVLKKDMLKAVMDDCVKYARGKDFESIILDKEGQNRFISWNLTPVFSAAKKIEGRLLVGQDITERREREISAKKIDDTLKNIFSTINDYALYLINLEGNITYFEMGSELMFGWRKKEILFKHASLLHPDRDGGNKLNHILEHVKLFGKYEATLELVNKDKKVIPVILTVNKFLDNHDKMIGYVFIAKDITERIKLERQVFQAEKMAAVGQLAAGMAHDINNPLLVISGRAQMLLDDGRLKDKVKTILNLIIAQTNRIYKLVDRILKFSRKSIPEFDTVDINEILESVMPLIYYHKLPAAKIEIEKNLLNRMPAVKGDFQQLQEVFLNLLINAHQAMPEGGVIRVSTSNFQNLYAQIIISDNGQGISPDNLKNIFMPFFSTKSDGTGLGLSICYNIIKNHNGTIGIESQIKKGTTVTIKLPFA